MSEWQLSNSMNFGGATIRFDQRGSGSPVVLVHGTPWSSFNLRHLVQDLSRDHAVYYFDLLGYGQSDKPDADVSLGVQNDLLDALLSHWELDDPVVIGHDFGGATALRTRLLNQRAFKRLVLIDAVAVSPWGSPFFRHVREHESAFAGVPDYIHDAVVRAYVKTAAHQRLDEAVLDAIVEPWTGAEGKAGFYRQIAQADARFTDEVQPRYGEIGEPVLIVWGREDSWIPLSRAESLHESMRGSRLEVIDDAGHLVIEEKPAELLGRIRAFLAN